MPKYSFVVPVFNVEKYLSQCIESILFQTVKDFELILIDDESSDKSGDICDYYQERDERITVIHKKNEGVSIARNTGIREAKGDFIIFVDSDDWLNTNLLQTIDCYTNDYELIFFGHIKHFANGGMIAYHPSENSCKRKEGIDDIIFQLKINQERFEYFGFTWNKVFKSSVIKESNISFVGKLALREDELFTMRYCQRISSIKVVSDTLYNYRCYNAGLTNIYKTSDEIMLFADAMYEMVGNWNSHRLRHLDSFRYAIFVLWAAKEEYRIFRCLKLTITACKIRKHTYDASFSYLNKGTIKINAIIVLIYTFVHCIINKLKVKS